MLTSNAKQTTTSLQNHKTNQTYFNWSSGKDAALAYHYFTYQEQRVVDRFFTTVNGHYNRVTMHGLRVALLEQQCEAIGMSLDVMELPEQPSMETYGRMMQVKLESYKKEGFSRAVFGDIFLEDLKAYREQQLNSVGIQSVFPLWKKETTKLVQELVQLGYKAIIICIDGSKLDPSFLGRTIDEQFLLDLPLGVDPCGENGEFHTFCYDGPIFQKPVSFKLGEKVFRPYEVGIQEEVEVRKAQKGFWFLDLLPT